MKRLLERLGLGRRDLRAWAMYDWANSAFQTTIVAAVFPIYFHKVAAAGLTPAEATSRFAWATTLAILIVAVIAPLLGAIADYAAVKKQLLAVFLGIGVVATGAMYWIETRRLGARARPVRRSATSASPEASCSTSRCCRILSRTRISTGCRQPATPSDISAAACCSPSTC